MKPDLSSKAPNQILSILNLTTKTPVTSPRSSLASTLPISLNNINIEKPPSLNYDETIEEFNACATNPVVSSVKNKYEHIPYSQIKAEHIISGLKIRQKSAIKSMLKTLTLLEKPQTQDNENLNFDNTILAIINAQAPFREIEGIYGHLKNVRNTPELQAASKQINTIISKFNQFFTRQEFTDLYLRYLKTDNAKQLSGAKKKYIDELMLKLKVSGAFLEPEEKAEFNQLEQEYNELKSQFRSNLSNFRNDLVIFPSEKSLLKGLSTTEIEKLKNDADILREQSDLSQRQPIPNGSYLINKSTYFTAMSKLENEGIRKQLYQQSLKEGGPQDSRGIFFSDGSNLDNSDICDRVLAIKQRQAQLVGKIDPYTSFQFNNHAELSTAKKMIGTVDNAMNFMDSLLPRIKALAKKEEQELIKFQQENYPDFEGAKEGGNQALEQNFSFRAP